MGILLAEGTEERVDEKEEGKRQRKFVSEFPSG